MEIGVIGLGRMGGNMAQRLLRAGHEVVAYDPVPDAVQAQARSGATASSSIRHLAELLAPPRAVWADGALGAADGGDHHPRSPVSWRRETR